MGIKDITCDGCGKKFNCAKNLNVHVANVHKAAKRFICDYCGRRFGKKIKLKVHMKSAHR